MKSIRRFTLIELLAVVALIAILSAIGFGAYSYAKGKAKESATEALLKQIEAGLESFNTRNGYYPRSGGNFSTISFTFAADGTVSTIDFGDANTKLSVPTGTMTKEKRMQKESMEAFTKTVDMQILKNNLGSTTSHSDGSISSGVLVDAWGNPIYYRSPGSFKTGSFDLVSAGADGVFSSSKSTDPKGITDLGKFRETTGEHLCDDVFNF